MQRLARTTLIGLTLAFVGVLVALVGALVALTTSAGARWSIAALDRLTPGNIAVGGVDGAVMGGLVLTDVRYDSPEVGVALASIVIELEVGELAHGRVVVDRLAIQDGIVSLRESESPPEPTGEPPPLSAIPEWLAVRSLTVRDVALVGGADGTIEELDASIADAQLTLDRLVARAAGGRLHASARARLEANMTGRIEGSYVLPLEQENAGEPATAAEARVQLATDFEIDAGATPWRATLAWDRFAVQAAETQWESPAGRLTVKLGTMPIEAELTAELTSAALPDDATVSATAHLGGETLELEELRIETLGGAIVTRGVASVSRLAGYAAFDYSMLDPSRIDPRVEGSLRGEVVVAFSSMPEVVAGMAGIVGGTLGGEPLDGVLRARLRDGVAQVDRARVELDRGVIEVVGAIGPQDIDLVLDAELPELTRWYPPAAGSLTAHASIVGATRDPALDVTLTANDLVLESLPPVEQLTVSVNGRLAEHEARVAMQGLFGAFSVRAGQSWSNERLAGTVLESRLAIERAGTWLLTGTADYSVSGADATLEPLCYAGPQQARLCVAIADDTLEVDADDLPSSLAEPWLAEGTRLAGAADLDLSVGWEPNLHGAFTLVQPTLRLRPAASADVEPAVRELAAIEDLTVTGALTADQLAVQLTAALAATGDPIEGRLTVAPPTAEGALDAGLTARLTSLELVDALFEDVEDLTGSIDVSLRAGGSPTQPELEGEITVRSLSAFVPPLGIEISNGRLSARADGRDTLEFDAALCSMGCVALDGVLDLTTPAAPWRLTADLTGESFVLADVQDLRAVIAPELMLDATREAWLVTGELVVEEGLAVIEAVPRSAVRPAAETVVHGRAAEPETEELPVPLVLDVDVLLGDVSFAGLGIAAELDGRLDIERTAEGRLIVNGTASIEEGTFTAYGQELTIERGDLLFTGPSDNPALDVRATREVEGAIVGLTITGPLRDPRSEIFSMPALSDSEALARLVTGRSLESAGPADAEAIERAALGLGIRRALPALERIGESLGLDELGVESAGDESGALVAGRQLGEDVYLRYKHGLFDDFAGFELIYRITERFRLRTETGTSQSIDIIYERNPRRETPLEQTEDPFEDGTRRAAERE